MRTITALTAALFLAVLAAQAVEEIPPEIEGFFEVAGNEEKLVSAVRGFDLLQQDLAEWDMELAREHQGAGDEDLARMKADSARRRMELIQRAWKEVLRRYPDNARANNYYGEFLYDRLNEHVEALKHWHLAVAQDRKLPEPHNNLGIYYTHFGDYKRGLRHMQTALDLDPDNPDFLFNMTQFYLIHHFAVETQRGWDKEKVYREAMKMSRKAARVSEDDFDLWQDYAVNFFASENFGATVNWSEAAAAWQKTRTLARNPTERFFTLLNEGRVWMRAEEYEAALEPLRAALKLRPDSEAARKLLNEAEAEAAAGSPA